MIRSAAIVLSLAAVFAAGCSQKPTQLAPSDIGRGELQDIWDIYSSYAAQYKKPPTKVDDLKPMARGSPLGGRSLLSPDYVVLYGTPVGGDNVLAYHKDVPTAGGMVLLSDGQIKQLSAEEFGAAPKAGK